MKIYYLETKYTKQIISSEWGAPVIAFSREEAERLQTSREVRGEAIFYNDSIDWYEEIEIQEADIYYDTTETAIKKLIAYVWEHFEDLEISIKEAIKIANDILEITNN